MEIIEVKEPSTPNLDFHLHRVFDTTKNEVFVITKEYQFEYGWMKYYNPNSDILYRRLEYEDN